MATEKEKMLAGMFYQAWDKQLVEERLYARKLTRLYNQTEETERETRTALLRQLFGSTGEYAFIEPPFHCDYGYNIHVGANFYANFDCVILAVCLVTIGKNCAMAPGISIGNNVVIASGSIITKDLPDNVVVAGNPAQIIKYL